MKDSLRESPARDDRGLPLEYCEECLLQTHTPVRAVPLAEVPTATLWRWRLTCISPVPPGELGGASAICLPRGAGVTPGSWVSESGAVRRFGRLGGWREAGRWEPVIPACYQATLTSGRLRRKRARTPPLPTNQGLIVR